MKILLRKKLQRMVEKSESLKAPMRATKHITALANIVEVGIGGASNTSYLSMRWFADNVNRRNRVVKVGATFGNETSMKVEGV